MPQYWFNTTTRQVEEESTRSKGDQLLGPYETREAAEQALETARQRTEAWDAQDAEWERDPDR